MLLGREQQRHLSCTKGGGAAICGVVAVKAEKGISI